MPASLRQALRFGEHDLLHYAWLIVAVGAAAQMVGSAIRMAFGVLVDPFTATFGWSAGAVGLTYAWMSIVSALLAPLAGWLGDRYGARKTMSAGIVLFLAGMVWTSQASQLWELYLAYGGLLGAAQSLFLVPVIPALAQWFRRHLGLGTGVMMMSWAIGPAIVVQLMAFLFESVGWRETFLTAGIAGTVVLAGMMALFRNSPEEANRKPYGWRTGDRPLAASTGIHVPKARRYQRHIYRTHAFWNLINIHFLGCVGHAVILVGIVPMAIHRGLSPVSAAGVLAVVSLLSGVSRFVAPVLGDRIGSKGVMFAAHFGQGVAVLLLLTANSAAGFYLFAVLFALPYGGEGTVFPVINRQYYGHFPIGTTYGWQILGAGLGMALGGAIPGFTFDYTGGYTTAIALSAATSLAGAMSILLLKPTHRLLIPDWSREAPAALLRPDAKPGSITAD